MMNDNQISVAFAPATTSNLAVGFDILGFPLNGMGDEVYLTKRNDARLIIQAVEGGVGIPLNSQQNTTTAAMHAMLQALNIMQGFDVVIKKGIPLGSGLGGSAASAVAGVVALNHFLKQPLAIDQLIPFALAGEQVATGAIHGDNVIPCLYGGMTLIQNLTQPNIIQLPDIGLHTVFIHPHMQMNTRDARAVLKADIPLADVILQNANTAAFISALYQSDFDLLATCCKDIMIEPMRAHLIPFFYEVKEAALSAGALACSISGAGPTLFAFTKNREDAKQVASAMAHIYAKHDMGCDDLISTVSAQGARIISE